jgi:hypothetical protein
MNDLSIKDLIDLVASKVEEADNHVKQIFEWEHSRRLEIIKWQLAASVALFIPVLVSFFKGEISSSMPIWLVPVALFGCILLAITGFMKLSGMRKWQRNYVSSIKLLADLKEITPFIKRYRSQ